MALVLDAGPLIAYYNRQDAWHEAVRRLLDEEEFLVLPMPVIPEVDYVLESRLGSRARLAFYEDPVGQVYQTVGLPESGYARVPELNGRYPELGFVDAAVIATAEELRISRIATLDRQHLGRGQAWIPLELLPKP